MSSPEYPAGKQPGSSRVPFPTLQKATEGLTLFTRMLSSMTGTASPLRRCWALRLTAARVSSEEWETRPGSPSLQEPDIGRAPGPVAPHPVLLPYHSRASHVERAVEVRGRPETTEGPMSPHCQQWSAGAHMSSICSPAVHQNPRRSQRVGKCSQGTRMLVHTNRGQI